MRIPGLEYYRDLVIVLVGKEFKSRYKNTALGYAWSILHPLAFTLVFFFVFKTVMRIQVENYGLFLITSLFPWQWFQNSVNGSTSAFLVNTTLIKRVRFPRYFLVVSAVLNDLIHYLLSVPVIVVFLLLQGMAPRISWLWLFPLLLVLQFLVTFGLSLLVATFNLFFRDLERLTSIFTMLLFYLTPVVYPIEAVPAGYRWTLYLNPMASLVASWRELYWNGEVYWRLLAVGAIVSLGVAACGVLTYRRLQWRFAEVV